MKYKWLFNAKKFIVILPGKEDESDEIINVSTMNDLFDAAKEHGFPVLGHLNAD